MNNDENKKPNKAQIIAIIVLGVLFFACLSYLITDLIMDKVKKGWTANDTIYFLFSCVLATVMISTFPPLADYYIDKNKGVVFSRTSLYQAIDNLNSINKLEQYRLYLLEKRRDKYIAKMNKLLDKKDIEHEIITKSNIGEMFSFNYEQSIFNLDIKFNVESRLVGWEIKYNSEVCPEYDNLYRLYKSGDLLKQRQFPLQNLILPFLFSLVSIFVVVYQALSVDNTIDISVWEYLKIIGSGAFMGVVYSLYRISPEVNTIKKENKETIKDINAFLEENQ